jgi:hypothetical protein
MEITHFHFFIFRPPSSFQDENSIWIKNVNPTDSAKRLIHFYDIKLQKPLSYLSKERFQALFIISLAIDEPKVLSS